MFSLVPIPWYPPLYLFDLLFWGNLLWYNLVCHWNSKLPSPCCIFTYSTRERCLRLWAIIINISFCYPFYQQHFSKVAWNLLHGKLIQCKYFKITQCQLLLLDHNNQLYCIIILLCWCFIFNLVKIFNFKCSLGTICVFIHLTRTTTQEVCFVLWLINLII